VNARALRLPRWSLPLLGRELIESSNRRRTYFVRMVFVLLALTLFGSEYLSYTRLHMQLGMGRYLFESLAGCMYIGIFLLLPAMAASSMTQEKEQGTLILLMLTLMGPWQLILQKFLSLTVLMLALLLGTLPLLGMSYVMGGLDFSAIWTSILAIVLTILEFSALGLAIGTWCRRTTAAIICAYLVVGGMLMLWFLLQFLNVQRHSPFTQVLHCYTYCCPWLMTDQRHITAWGFVVPLGVTAGLLALARCILSRRLGIEGGSGVLGILRYLDRLFERGDTLLLKRTYGRDLPLSQPVWWLEVNRRSLANVRYLVRIFLPIYAVLFLIGTADPQEIGSLFGWSMTLLLLPLIVVHASALAQERGAQTLDVLLSTPLSGISVLRQKSRALARLRWAASGGLLMLVLIQVCCLRHTGEVTALQACMLAAGAILIPGICCWIAMLVGVGLKNHRKAAIVAILCCLGWLLGVPFLMELIGNLVSDGNMNDSVWRVLCPVLLLAGDRRGSSDLGRMLGIPGLICTLAGYLVLLWALRWCCIEWGSRWLYRGDTRASQ
jgi:hypothetical protein